MPGWGSLTHGPACLVRIGGGSVKLSWSLGPNWSMRKLESNKTGHGEATCAELDTSQHSM